MSESLSSFINLESTKSLRWAMTQHSEQLFNNLARPQTAGVWPRYRVTAGKEALPGLSSRHGLQCVQVWTRLQGVFPPCASVFIAFLIWFPGRMGLAGMKNEEVKERREVVWQVAFCPCQLVADPSRSWTLGPQLCECRFSGWLWL